MALHPGAIKRFGFTVLILITVQPSRAVAHQSPVNIERPHCRHNESIRITRAELMNNGSILDQNRNVLYPMGKWYQIDLTYFGCRCELSKVCLRKCCPLDSSYKHGREMGCQDSGQDFKTIVASDGLKGGIVKSHSKDFLLVGNSHCKGEDYRLRPEYYHDNAYRVLPDGSLSLPEWRLGKLRDDSYCFESDPESKNEAIPFVCLERLDAGSALSTPGFPIWRIPPTVFLLYSIVASLFMGGFGEPPMARMNGCLMMINLFVGRIVYVLVTTFSTKFEEMDTLLLALVVQFFLLCSAFWFNIMCLDAFLVTRDSKSPYRDIAAAGYARTFALEKRNFICRGIYTILWPLIIVITSGTTTKLPGIPRNKINPNASLLQVWYRANSVAQGCLLGSDAILLICNLMLCIITAASTLKSGSKRGVISKDPGMSVANQRLFTCIGLLLTIAANRAAEGYVWMFPRAYERLDVLDWANGMQDVIISLIISMSDIVKAYEISKMWFRRRVLAGETALPIRGPTYFTLWLLGYRPRVVRADPVDTTRSRA